jgi:hypothetical protein
MESLKRSIEALADYLFHPLCKPSSIGRSRRSKVVAKVIDIY